MCTELHIRDGNHWIEQTRELAAVIGRENILYWADDDTVTAEPPTFDPVQDDLAWCLCPVAVEETLGRLGYTVVNGWEEPERVDYVAFRPAALSDTEGR